MDRARVRARPGHHIVALSPLRNGRQLCGPLCSYAILLNDINDLSLLKSSGKNTGRKKGSDFCLGKNLKCLNGSGGKPPTTGRQRGGGVESESLAIWQ
jgi:hypothetical protein